MPPVETFRLKLRNVFLPFVRITLSFALDVELDGMAPWRRAEYEAGMATSGSDD